MCRFFFEGGGGEKIELLSPREGVKSPIDGILSKNGAIPYHICYRVRNIERAVNELRNIGFIMIENPTRSEPLGGVVCFMFSPEIGIIEIIEYYEDLERV